MYKIDIAIKEDLNTLLDLFNKASIFLNTNGVDQWQNGYPNKDVLINDINNKNLYVLKNDDKIVGVMAFIKEEEPTYKNIYNGKWLSSGIYYTIHRITVLEKGKGLSKYLFDFAFEKCIEDGVEYLRIDTHRDNIFMQRLLDRLGFSYCGIIYLSDGDERLAFERRVVNGK